MPTDGTGRRGATPAPSDAQAAAVDYLLKNQHQIAQALGAALVAEAPQAFYWDYLEGVLSEIMKRRLAAPEGVLQMVELETIVVGAGDVGGCARIRFAFHSELLEPEHGVGVVMLRDELLTVGTFDDLMDLDNPEVETPDAEDS